MTDMHLSLDRSRAVLLCADNDTEARMMLMLAAKAGIAVIRSAQPHGARLANEPKVFQKIENAQKPEVWIAEIPGPAEEDELRRRGYGIRIFDHHTYRELDRLTDPETGKPNPSTLEQFMRQAEISDAELVGWGFDPKTVRGIGIMDARYVEGLREAGYSRDDIRRVLEFSEAITAGMDPEREAATAAATEAWAHRAERGGYTVVVSDVDVDVRGAISHITILEGVDAHPMIISSKSGEKITVQNVGADVVRRLTAAITTGNTYTFGTGRCWGANNKDQLVRIALEQIFAALGV